MNQLLERLRKTFEDEDARYVYADSTVNAFIAAQIKALREDRELSQEELAILIGTKQSGISRLEKADYSSWKIGTLRKLARAFGVRLKISFEEFGTLLPDISGFSQKKLAPRRFSVDPVFHPELSATRIDRKRPGSEYKSVRVDVEERKKILSERPTVFDEMKQSTSGGALTPPSYEQQIQLPA